MHSCTQEISEKSPRSEAIEKYETSRGLVYAKIVSICYHQNINLRNKILAPDFRDLIMDILYDPYFLEDKKQLVSGEKNLISIAALLQQLESIVFTDTLYYRLVPNLDAPITRAIILGLIEKIERQKTLFLSAPTGEGLAPECKRELVKQINQASQQLCTLCDV